MPSMGCNCSADDEELLLLLVVSGWMWKKGWKVIDQASSCWNEIMALPLSSSFDDDDDVMLVVVKTNGTDSTVRRVLLLYCFIIMVW